MHRLLASLLVVGSVSVGSSAIAQGPHVAWTKTFGGASSVDGGSCVQQTQDGGYIIAGFSASGPDRDVLLIKTDAWGNAIWSRQYGDSLEQSANCVQETSTGDYITVGVTYCDTGGNYVSDVFLLKLDPIGDTIWTRTYGGAGYDRGECVTETEEGGYIVAGSTTSYGAGGADVYLVKTDSNGDTLWTKTWGWGGAQEGECVQQASDGGYIVAGWSIAADPDSEGVLLLKTDGGGNPVWGKVYGDIHSAAYSVQQVFDGGYVVCGFTEDFSSTGWKMWLLKTDAFGDTVWTRTYGGDSEDECNCVRQTADSGYVLVGHTWSYGAGLADLYLVKTDEAGDTLSEWGRCLTF